MAQSKNKRKNGKAVKSDRVKRMRASAGYDIKDLLVCNVVDRGELAGAFQMVPRTLTFSKKLSRIVSITQLQEVALKSERWQWEVHGGVVCRNPDGTVYIDKEFNFVCQNLYLLTELNNVVTDKLMAQFDKANHLHRLTMFWVASPFERKSTPLQAILAPVWHYNVLGNMLTKFEGERLDHEVLHFRSTTLESFCDWFLYQGKYKKDLNKGQTITFKFEPTGTKMKKGELVDFRHRLIELGGVNDNLAEGAKAWKPFASVEAFCQGEYTITCTGKASTKLFAAFEQVPPCVNCIVKVQFDDGTWNLLRWVHGQSYEETNKEGKYE